jgi:hypothetical protein
MTNGWLTQNHCLNQCEVITNFRIIKKRTIMKKLIILCALVLLFSCNQEEKERAKSKQNRATKIEEIKSRYGIKYSMVKLYDFDYSYQFNEVIKTEKQLLEYYTVHDIYTKNNQNYVKINLHKYYFELLVEDKSILQELLDSGYSESNMLIIKLDHLKKMDFVLDLYEDSYEDNTEFNMEVIENEKFIGKGKILRLIKI